MQLDRDGLSALDRRYRAALINGITGFKPASLVGSVSAGGQSNLAIMSSAVHLGSRPPLIGLVIRPGPAERHTLENILDSGVYTLNHVGEDFVEQAHQTAARYPREVSEFDAVGLTPHWHADFGAPFVAEALVRLGLILREHHPLEINGTHFLIGEIVVLDIPDDCVDSEGSIDLGAAGSVALSGLDTYHVTTPLKRMAYAKPDLPPRTLDPTPGR
jgi:flavin reductase (DIM6/NTAB) family NADH-FMN oxidoreductase RutF